MTGGRHMQGAVALLVCVLAVADITCPDREASTAESAGWPSELADLRRSSRPLSRESTSPRMGQRSWPWAYAESYYLASIDPLRQISTPGFALPDRSEPVSAVAGGPPGTSELHPRLRLVGTALLIGTARIRCAEHHPLSWRRHRRRLRVPVRRGRKIPNRDGYAANVGSSYDLNSGIFPMRIELRACTGWFKTTLV